MAKFKWNFREGVLYIFRKKRKKRYKNYSHTEEGLVGSHAVEIDFDNYNRVIGLSLRDTVSVQEEVINFLLDEEE
jgi:hypothetical protein